MMYSYSFRYPIGFRSGLYGGRKRLSIPISSSTDMSKMQLSMIMIDLAHAISTADLQVAPLAAHFC